MFTLQNASLLDSNLHPVLRDINLTLDSGRIHWVVGKSASGKSSLLKVLARDAPLTRGSLHIELDRIGLPQQHTRSRWRRNIGWISPSFDLIADQNLIENVCFPISPYASAPSSSIRKQGGDLMRRLQISHYAEYLPNQCPLGVNLLARAARSMIHSPNIIFCDAVFDSLDGQQQEDLVKSFLSLAESGTCVFVAGYSFAPIQHPLLQHYLMENGSCQVYE